MKTAFTPPGNAEDNLSFGITLHNPAATPVEALVVVRSTQPATSDG